MKKIVFTLALIGLVGCGSTDDLGHIPEVQASGPGEVIVGGGGPNDDDISTEEFAHLLNGTDVCASDFEPMVLKNKSGKIDLGINGSGYRVFADFELYLFEDGTFFSKYVETEDRNQTLYDGNGNLIPKPQRRKEIHSNWSVEGSQILLSDVGFGGIVVDSDKDMLGFIFSKDLISPNLAGKKVILTPLSQSSALLKKKVLCPEVYALGPFNEYREYQNNSVNGLEARDLVIDVYDSDKTWSFKVYIDENNNFDVEYFVKPEKDHAIWGWEDGKWIREGNVLSLGDLADLIITGHGVSIIFKRRMNVDNALPKDFREEFDQTGKEYSLDFTRGYL